MNSIKPRMRLINGDWYKIENGIAWYWWQCASIKTNEKYGYWLGTFKLIK